MTQANFVFEISEQADLAFLVGLRCAEGLNVAEADSIRVRFLKLSQEQQSDRVLLMAICLDAVCLFFKGEPSRALDLTTEGLKRLKSIPEADEISSAIWNINAVSQISLNHTKKAVLAFESAIHFAKKGRNVEMEIRSKSNLARLLRYIGDYESSLVLLNDLMLCELVHSRSISSIALKHYRDYRVNNGIAMTLKCMAENEIGFSLGYLPDNANRLLKKATIHVDMAVKAATDANDSNRKAFSLDTKLQIELLKKNSNEHLIVLINEIKRQVSPEDKRGEWMLKIAEVRMLIAQDRNRDALAALSAMNKTPQTFHPDLHREFSRAKILALQASGKWQEAFNALNAYAHYEIKQRNDQVEQKRIFMLSRIENDIKEATLFLTHDLRMPLHRIETTAQDMAARDTSDERPAERIAKDASRTIKLVDSFLAFLETKSLVEQQFEDVELSCLLDDACAEVGLSSFEKGIEIRLNTPQKAQINGVRSLLHRAILNVLDNAIRHSAKAVPIAVTLEPIEHYWCIRIDDNGPGFHERLGSASSKDFSPAKYKRQGGRTGIGLRIADGILKHHSGKLRFLNRAEGGASVQMLIPMQLTNAPPFVL
jgi:signal transduction histidine kinase